MTNSSIYFVQYSRNNLFFLSYYRGIRESNPPKILMNLCCGYILLYAVFLTAVTETEAKLRCQIIAAVLQYLLLCIFSWCAIEGFYSFRAMVLPYSLEIRHFMWKAMVIGWGKYF